MRVAIVSDYGSALSFIINQWFAEIRTWDERACAESIFHALVNCQDLGASRGNKSRLPAMKIQSFRIELSYVPSSPFFEHYRQQQQYTSMTALLDSDLLF